MEVNVAMTLTFVGSSTHMSQERQVNEYIFGQESSSKFDGTGCEFDARVTLSVTAHRLFKEAPLVVTKNPIKYSSEKWR